MVQTSKVGVRHIVEHVLQSGKDGTCTGSEIMVVLITYLILTEYEVNIENKSQVKDRGEAEVFYKVFYFLY